MKNVKIIFSMLLSLTLFFCNKNTFSQNNKNDTGIMVVVEQMPEFPGGQEKMLKFLAKNIMYPDSAKENNFQGSVVVKFIVEKDGTISNIEILKGIGGGCDEECVRVIKIMPKWKPGKQKGENVRVQFILPIKFTLQ